MDQQDQSSNPKQNINYYAQDGSQDYLIGEAQLNKG